MNVLFRNIGRQVWTCTNVWHPLEIFKRNNFQWALMYNSPVIKNVVSNSGGADILIDSRTKRNMHFVSYDVQLKARRILQKLIFMKTVKQDNLYGYKLYTTISNININEFFEFLEIEDTFYSWFKVITLHVWMLLVKCMQDNKCSRNIRKSIVNAMWEDAHMRAKSIDAKNPQLKKNFNTLCKEFKMSLLAYDEGLLASDTVLFNALWYYFFDSNCDDPRKIEALISYIRHQVNHLFLSGIPDNPVEKLYGTLWTPLKPHILNAS